MGDRAEAGDRGCACGHGYLVLGIPVLYLFLFLAWVMLIALMALIVERPQSEEDLAEGEQAPDVNRGQTASREAEPC